MNTRVVKFDKNGKYLMTWGQAWHDRPRRASGEAPRGDMNNVHGIAVDPARRGKCL